MKPMKQTHRTTEFKYDSIREKSLEIATANLPLFMTNNAGQTINVRGAASLGMIDVQARAQAKNWHDSSFRRVDWPWMKSVAIMPG